MRKLLENPYVDIIGHPHDGRFPVDMKRLVNKAKKTGTLLEVNNSSLRPEGFRGEYERELSENGKGV